MTVTQATLRALCLLTTVDGPSAWQEGGWAG